MPRARDPNRDKAFELWKNSQGKITNRALATMLDVPEKTISAWKSRDKWNAVLQTDECSTTNKKSSKRKSAKVELVIPEPVIQNDELTDKQKEFCLQYLKYFNATKAYQKAYGVDWRTANASGARMLVNVSVRKEIERLKAERQKSLFLDSSTVLQKYIDIAFADITDFVSFGSQDVQAIDEFGEPMVDHDGNPITYPSNFVRFAESGEIDGTIITEVKKGKDGVSLKLADKMKALDVLTRYFDLLPEHQKRKLEEEKIKVEIETIQGDKTISEDWVSALKEVAEKRKSQRVSGDVE